MHLVGFTVEIYHDALTMNVKSYGTLYRCMYLISVYVPYIGVCTLYRCMYLIFSHRRFKGRSTAVSRNRGHVTARISNITQATKHCFKYIYTYSKYTQYMRVTTPKYTTAIAGILLHHNIVPQLLVYYCSS